MAFNAKGRSIWKPMHLQLIYRNNVFITTQSVNRRRSNVYIDEGAITDNGRWLFKHGLYLPSDNKMIDDLKHELAEKKTEAYLNDMAQLGLDRTQIISIIDEKKKE